MLRDAYAAAVADLKRAPSYWTPVPSSYEVLAVARRMGLACTRASLITACGALKLLLTDSDL